MSNRASETTERRSGCFHRTVAVAATILIIAIIVIGADRLLVKKLDLAGAAPPPRHIRLRENPPGATRYLLPTGEFVNPAKLPAASSKKTFIVRTDSNGFIEPSGVHDSPDFSVVFLGGSTTECLFMNEKSRFPYLAGRMIENKTGLKVNAYNGGVSGNNSLHSINILINKVIPMKPDVVVMMHNVNDLMTLVHEGSYYNDNKYRSVIIAAEKRSKKAALMSFLKDILPGVGAATEKIITKISAGGAGSGNVDEWAETRNRAARLNHDEMVEQFKRNLRIFVSTSRAGGINPVMMTQGNHFDYPGAREAMKKRFQAAVMSADEIIELHKLFNDAIRDVGKEKGVIVIDLDRGIPRHDEYFQDAAHFSEKGARAAAKIISDRLSTVAIENHNGE